MKSAKGAYLTDEDDRNYIDYINSWGPAILGHTHPEVLEALKSQAEKGFSFGTPTELETEIAKYIVENVPNVDQIRMISSGTEIRRIPRQIGCRDESPTGHPADRS